MTTDRLVHPLARLATIFVLSACAADTTVEEETMDLAESQDSLYSLSTRIWTTRSIPVCWTVSGFNTDKQNVQASVARSWQANLNLIFTGWGDCPTSGFNGIAVTPGSANVVTGGLGKQPDGISDVELDFGASPQNTWSRCINNSLTRDGCIAATSIHEFGHALGFAHEQLRPDNNGTCNNGLGSGTAGDTTHGPFDNVSIMNYCGDNTRLSSGDTSGAVTVYRLAPALIVTVIEAA